MSDYFDLGSYTRRVTTDSDRAQTWFTRGLLWTYGFNHEEATACFERSAEADPGCVMAYWGLAYALGPNYNKPWEAFAPGGGVRVDLPCFGRASRGRKPRRTGGTGGARPGGRRGLTLPSRRAGRC